MCLGLGTEGKGGWGGRGEQRIRGGVGELLGN